MTIFLAILAVFLVLPGAASADPVSSAIFTFLAWSGVPTGLATTIATFATRVIIGAATSLLGQLFQDKPKTKQRGIQTEQTTAGDTTPLTFIVGRYATEGHLIAPNYSRGKNNKIMSQIMDISNLPVKGLTGRVIVDGEYITLGQLNSEDPSRQDFVEFGVDESNNPRGWLWFYDGTQTSAQFKLVEQYASHPDRPWTTDHILQDTAYAVCEFVLNKELYSGFPRMRFEVNGISLYDPRKDTTVGGSGSHRWDDPSMWEFTKNPQVINYNILRGITLPNGDVWGGQIPAEDLPLADWFAAMNACDVLIDGRPTYEAGFEIDVSQEPFEIIKEMNKASFAQMSELGGVFKVRVGAPASPVLSITDEDIVITKPSDLNPFPGLAQTSNAITGTYVEPIDVWQGRSADPIYNSTWEADDGERRLTNDVGLPAVTNKSQAQHLLNSYINDNRRFATHGIVLPASYATLEPLDTIEWTSERNGYTAKVFEVVELEDQLDTMLQFVRIREREATDSDWTASDEVADPLPVNGLTPPADLVPSLTLTGVTIDDDSSANVLPAIKIAWSEDGFEPEDSIKWEVRKTSGSVVVASGLAGADSGETTIAGVAGNTAYEVRARYVVGVPTDWSAWGAVTTPNVALGGTDGTDGVSTFLVPIYKRAATAPSTPTGGSYDFGTETLSPPSGWSEEIPNVDGNPAWVSTALASVQGTTGTDSSLSWGVPKKIAQDGADGAAGTDGTDGKSTYQAAIFKRAATAPSAPTGGSFDFGTETLTTPAGWSESVPVDDGNPVWVTRFLFSVSGDTGSDTAGTWATPAKLAEDGAAGTDGTDGADGTDGLSVTEVQIYQRLGSQPSTPSGGDYDFGTRTLTPPLGWSAEPPATNGDPLWASRATASVQGTTGTDSSLSWSTPAKIVEDGVRGPGRWNVSVTFLPTTSGEAQTAWDADSSTPTTPVESDQAWFFTGTEANPTGQTVWIYRGTSWTEQDEVIDGNLLVSGTVTAGKVSIGDSSLSADAQGDLIVQGGNITVLKDNFYSATPLGGNGWSNPPVAGDLQLVGGSAISIPAGFTADLQLVVSFQHGYYDLSADNDWGLQVTSGGSAFGGVTEKYARFDPPMSLETDFATVTIVVKGIENTSTTSESYNVYVSWNAAWSSTTLDETQFTVGKFYEIDTLGSTDWNDLAGTTGVSYSVGDIFECVNTSGTDNGGVARRARVELQECLTSVFMRFK